MLIGNSSVSNEQLRMISLYSISFTKSRKHNLAKLDPRFSTNTPVIMRSIGTVTIHQGDQRMAILLKSVLGLVPCARSKSPARVHSHCLARRMAQSNDKCVQYHAGITRTHLSCDRDRLPARNRLASQPRANRGCYTPRGRRECDLVSEQA